MTMKVNPAVAFSLPGCEASVKRLFRPPSLARARSHALATMPLPLDGGALSIMVAVRIVLATCLPR